MFQLYLHDMSEFTKLGVAGDGKYEFDQEIIEAYFREAQHFPYFILHENDIAGFALVRKYPYDKSVLDMGQFFVLRKHARKGVGQRAFELCLQKHPGEWQVRILPQNLPAQSFWKATISKLTGNEFSSRTADYQVHKMNFLSFSYPGMT
jgi:predicted acetyltransferase